MYRLFIEYIEYDENGVLDITSNDMGTAKRLVADDILQDYMFKELRRLHNNGIKRITISKPNYSTHKLTYIYKKTQIC